MCTGVRTREFSKLVALSNVQVLTRARCGADEGKGFARVREDDVIGWDWAGREHERNLVVRRAVESTSEGGEEADDVWVWVALHLNKRTCKNKNGRTIKRLHVGQRGLPAQMLAVHVREVGDEECLPRVAEVVASR